MGLIWGRICYTSYYLLHLLPTGKDMVVNVLGHRSRHKALPDRFKREFYQIATNVYLDKPMLYQWNLRNSIKLWSRCAEQRKIAVWQASWEMLVVWLLLLFCTTCEVTAARLIWVKFA